jgi:Raf kinase inhibitor-like YbhB/YbcL family protein
MMWLSSDAFTDGSPIPRRFTCEGADVSPPLRWGDAPAATGSFVLLCDDPDAPSGTWCHWAAYDIPPERTGLAEGVDPDDATLKQATNDSHTQGYSGPCPPHGHGPHRYHFRLLALSVPHLPAMARPTCQAVERAARRHLVEEAVLIGTSERK